MTLATVSVSDRWKTRAALLAIWAGLPSVPVVPPSPHLQRARADGRHAGVAVGARQDFGPGAGLRHPAVDAADGVRDRYRVRPVEKKSSVDGQTRVVRDIPRAERAAGAAVAH